MDDCNTSALHHEHRTRSLGRSADSANGVSVRSSKSLSRNAGSSRTGSVSFNKCSSGRFSKSSGTVRSNHWEEDQYFGEDFAKASSGNHSDGVYDRFGSANASGYDDVFGGPPKYASPNFKTQPSMYEEIFRMPPKVLSASKLSDLPVFDPPSYSNDEVFGGASVFKGSAAAAGVRYEDIFGGGLPIGPTHVGATELFGTLETRSFGKLHRSLRRKSLNSVLQKKEDKTQQPADCKSEQIGSNISSSSSTVSFNDVNVLLRPERSSERASNQISRNGVIQRDSTKGSTHHSCKGPGAAFIQTRSSAPAKENSREAHVTELPKVNLLRKSDSSLTRDWLESDDAVLQRHKESKHEKHSAKEFYRNGQVRSFAGANQQTSFYEHVHGSNHPLPARSKTSVAGATYVVGGEELTTENTSAVNLHSKKSHGSTPYSRLTTTDTLQQREEDAKLAEVGKENEEEEYASVDGSVSSYEEVQISSNLSSEIFTSDNLQQAEDLTRLADTSEERQTEQLRRENGVPHKGKDREVVERNAKSVQEATSWGEKAREAPAKEKHTDERERKEGTASVREKHREKREQKRSELLEEREKQAKDAKDYLANVTHTKAVVDIQRKENGAMEEGKKGTYRTEKASRIQELERRAIVDALERREKEVREERERERLRRESELERQREREREREKDRMEVERATKEAKEKAAFEAQAMLERLAFDARERAERAAMDRTPAEARVRATSERADRATVERVAAEARARAERVALERVQAEARGRRGERTAVERDSTDVCERGDRATAENLASGREYSWRKTISTAEVSYKTNVRDFVFGKGFTNGEARNTTGVSSVLKNVSSTITADDSRSFSASNFPEVEGETAERRQGRWERHQRTLERAAKALAEKNQRDLEVQQEQAEKHRIAGMLDAEIRRWSAGKQGNLRALLSTLQNVLWRESGWQPVSLTDLISPAAVKKAYRKATLCVHPDKVQQKGASVQQKYTAEKVFDLLKEAWNKFNLEEQC
ncbi:hypothetical protein O6H91_07G096300 [Diphasiastrum complanatum]|uniref:Uncharacterized protein n=1 Tax=Diphasiastrum complanatum TaxID=34168 RepID=A0ACC2D7V1_DIPCM|nr:hypothetical protein O6H91_07G096300 [Diphasiastrum complanatum]